MTDVTAPVLDIRDLSVTYETERGPLRALRDVSLCIKPGSIVGIVGESGCGKSTLISAIIRLLSPNVRIEKGAMLFKGQNLLDLDSEAMRAMRGVDISVVFQDPMTSLNPVLTIGRQMTDIQYRLPQTRADNLERASRLLERVGIADAAEQMNRYPHHLSGGMRQRVAIAMALMTEPALLIADEPTTALDATLEVQIIERLKQLQSDFGCAVLFISHHLGVIAELCDEVAVMYAGEVVESGATAAVFANPKHPYTKRLLACDPASLKEPTPRLPVIDGSLPDLTRLSTGCIFSPRCSEVVEVCNKDRPRLLGKQHRVACHVVTNE